MSAFNSAPDFWNGMVVPDYNDFRADTANLRAALHCAVSLFHLSDWVYVSFEPQVRSTFNVNTASGFGNSLEQTCSDFALVRGIANAAKHLALKNVRPHADAPSHAANTRSQSIGYGQGSFGMGPYNGPQVVLEGSNGYLHFEKIVTNVFGMWQALASQHSWW